MNKLPFRIQAVVLACLYESAQLHTFFASHLAFTNPEQSVSVVQVVLPSAVIYLDWYH